MPNGNKIYYPNAQYFVRGTTLAGSAGYTDMYTKKDGDWIARIPDSCILDHRHESKVAIFPFSINDAMQYVIDHAHQIPRWSSNAKLLKRLFANWSIRNGEFKIPNA
jgi:hypothetical protein